MIVDIRKQLNVTKIIFAEKRGLWLDATHLMPHTQGGVTIHCDGTSEVLLVKDRECVDNLIRSLEKAKELGWV